MDNPVVRRSAMLPTITRKNVGVAGILAGGHFRYSNYPLTESGSKYRRGVVRLPLVASRNQWRHLSFNHSRSSSASA
jgi:hypothetical protein